MKRASPENGRSRRDFLRQAGGATLGLAGIPPVVAATAASGAPSPPTPFGRTRFVPLYPQRNRHRDVLDLSGLWDFALDPDEVGERDGWFHRLPSPRRIAVPASWNEQFEDTRDYFGVAWYLTRVFIPSSWRGRSVLLRVSSATYATRAWVDGRFLGSHDGGHLPFAFDLTEVGAVEDRPLTIALRVENKLLPQRVPPGGRGGGLGGSFPDVPYDFFPYCGLDRPVALCAIPPTPIDDVTVATSIDGAAGVIDATIVAAQFAEGRGEVRLEGGDARVASEIRFLGGIAHARLRIDDARLWSPEDPFLYAFRVALRDGDREIDSYELEVGIRTVEVRGDQLLLNGRPVMLRGFGKHEDFPVHGRGLDLPVLVKDFALLKWLGANSFRTSHYPYSEEAMRLADREGLLVIDETPAVGLAFDDAALVSAWLATCKVQVGELIARDKNHPSVIFWSLANEPLGSSGGEERERGYAFLHELFAHARALDGTRPVIFVAENGTDPSWLALSDVVALNAYRGWYVEPGQLDRATAALARQLDALHAAFGKPVLLSEFGADAVAGWHSEPPQMWSEEYQSELVRRYLELAAERGWIVGTHIWNFADFRTAQSTFRPQAMNFKGVFTRDRQPKMTARLLRAQWTRLR